MEDYRITADYKSAKILTRILKLLVVLRVVFAVFLITSLFLFIWIDLILAIRIFLTALLAAALVYGAYLRIQKRLKQLHG